MRNKPESEHDPKIPVSIRLDADLRRKLKEHAKAQKRTVSNLINSVIRQLLDRNEIELPETEPNKKSIGEIALLLQVQIFNHIGCEEYINGLKTSAKELNISDDDMFRILTAVIERVWQLQES